MTEHANIVTAKGVLGDDRADDWAVCMQVVEAEGGSRQLHGLRLAQYWLLFNIQYSSLTRITFS